jgi:phenylacetate-CoA oxygenase PaaH subunit
VTAADSEMALLMAKECFLRRREGEHLWVVNRGDIHSFSDESLLEVAADKSYRFPEAYRDVVGLREKARERAEQLAGRSSG